MDHVFGEAWKIFKDILPAFPIAALLRVPVILWRRRRGKPVGVAHEVGLVLLAVSLVAILTQTMNFEALLQGYADPGYLRVNLVPSISLGLLIRAGRSTVAALNVYGNILMFMPIGFFPPLLWRKMNILKTVSVGCLLSVVIEIVQLFSARGTDIDDVILNTLGTLLGYAVYLLFSHLFPKFSQRFLTPAP